MLCFFFFVCFNLFAKEESVVGNEHSTLKSELWESVSWLFKKNKNVNAKENYVENTKLINEAEDVVNTPMRQSLEDVHGALYCLNEEKVEQCPAGSTEITISEVNEKIQTGSDTTVTIYVYGLNNDEKLNLSKKGLTVNIVGKTAKAAISPSFENKETNIALENIEITQVRTDPSSSTEESLIDDDDSVNALFDALEDSVTLSALTLSLKDTNCNEFIIESQNITADFKSLNTVESVNVTSVITLTGEVDDIKVFPTVTKVEKVVLPASTSLVSLGSEEVSLNSKCVLNTNSVELPDSERELIICVNGTENHPQLSLINNKSPSISLEGEKSQSTISIDRTAEDFLELSVESESTVSITGNPLISTDFDSLAKLNMSALDSNTQIAFQSDKEQNAFTYENGTWTIVADGEKVEIPFSLTSITLTNDNSNTEMSIQSNITSTPIVEISGTSTISVNQSSSVSVNITLVKGEDCTVNDDTGIFDQITKNEDLDGSEFCILASSKSECPSSYNQTTVKVLNKYLEDGYAYETLSLFLAGKATDELDLSGASDLKVLTVMGTSKTTDSIKIKSTSPESSIQLISVSDISLTYVSINADKLEATNASITCTNLNATVIEADFSSIENVKYITSENVTFTSGNPGDSFKNVQFNGVKILDVTSSDVTDLALDNTVVAINGNAKIDASAFNFVSQNDITLNIQGNESLLNSSFRLSSSLTINGSEVRESGKLRVRPYAVSSTRKTLEDENSESLVLILNAPVALNLEESISVALNYNSAVNLILIDENNETLVSGATITISQTNEVSEIELSENEFKLSSNENSVSFLKSSGATFKVVSLAQEEQTITIKVIGDNFYNPTIQLSSYNTANVSTVNVTSSKLTLVCTNTTKVIGNVESVNIVDESGKEIDPVNPDGPTISPGDTGSEPKKSHVGAIVGGVVAGVVVIAVIVVLTIWYIKTPHEATDTDDDEDNEILYSVAKSNNNSRQPKFAEDDEVRTDDLANFRGEFWI